MDRERKREGEGRGEHDCKHDYIIGYNSTSTFE